MNIFLRSLFAASLLAVFCGCGGRGAGFSLSGCDTLYHPACATGFELLRHKSGDIVLVVKTPWQDAGEKQFIYILSADKNRTAEGADLTVQVPIERAVCMSSSHIAFLDVLEAGSAVVGVSGAKYITNEKIADRIQRGTVRDVGNETVLNKELLLALNPDVLFAYGVAGENDLLTESVREMGVKPVYIGEYLENDPLGRLEWIVAIGAFVGKIDEAVGYFETVRAKYDSIRGGCRFTEKPVVMVNSPWRDTWFVPSDGSYLIRLIGDAGGDYACKGTPGDKSLPISFETAFVNLSAADIWLAPGTANSLDEIRAAVPKVAETEVFKKGAVYNNNRRSTPGGGSDFWEGGIVHPDIILRDMIRILHPEALPGHELYYFHQLK